MSPAHERGLSGRQPKAVLHALAILEAVARSGAGISAREIADELGLSPATTYRLLNLLVGEEYLVRLEDLHGFALGRKVARLVGDNPWVIVSSAAREVVSQLRSQTRHAIHLVLCTATSLRCVDIDPDHPLDDPEMLERHLHASAPGKLLLAEQPDWKDVQHPRRLHQLTDRTVVRATDLEAELLEIRRRGRAVQVGQLHDGLACAAIPVRAPVGVLVGALVVTVRSNDPAAPVAHAHLVEKYADQLGPLLG